MKRIFVPLLLSATTPGTARGARGRQIEIRAILEQVRQLIDAGLTALEQTAEQADDPWTGERFPKPPA